MKNGFKLFERLRDAKKAKQMVDYRSKKIEKLDYELRLTRLESDLEKVKREFRELKKQYKG